jgi:hypothetical protein
MNSEKIKFKSISLGLLLGLNLSGCADFKKIWGEAPPPRKTVILKSETLPDFIDFFSDDDRIAESALTKYENFVLDSFDKLKGKEENRISIEEIKTLAKYGLAELSKDQKTSLARIDSALSLMGFKNGITRQQIQDLLRWCRENRIQAKAFYDTLIRSDPKDLTSSSLIEMLHFTGSLIQLGGSDSLNPVQVSSLIKPWIPLQYPHAIQSLTSGIDLMISIFSSLCGDRVDANSWNAKKNGQCLITLTDHFQSTAPIFDLMFDRLNPITEKSALATANATFVYKVQNWIKDHHHPRFPTQKVANFASDLDIPAPYNFLKLTEWIPKLNSASTPEYLSPGFFIDLSKMIQEWVNTLLKVTADSDQDPVCRSVQWRSCIFKGKYETADKLYNPEYATLIREKNLDFIFKISFYDSIGDYLIQLFDDDQDGVLQQDIKDLITIVIRLLDSNSFTTNVFLRIQEKPIMPKNTDATLNSFRRQGLAEVAALAADLIPDQGNRQRSILKKLSSQVYDPKEHPVKTLDRLGITTFLYVYNLLENLREQFLIEYPLDLQKVGAIEWVSRRKIVENIPRMLHDHFPRIYNDCLSWGFERTCGVIYTEVLASSPDNNLLEPVEMDILNLTSILLESMMNRCDRNKDDRISSNLIDGFDEKDCVISVSQALAIRLMNANIIDDEKKTRVLLRILNWLPPAKWMAKSAISKGTLKGLNANVWKDATLGSIMSLAAELMDPEKVDAINGKTFGHHEDTGDDLIYFQRLSDQYLPSKGLAPRTSQTLKAIVE